MEIIGKGMAGKTVIQTPYALEFAGTMDEASVLRYNAILDVEAALKLPWARK